MRKIILVGLILVFIVTLCPADTSVPSSAAMEQYSVPTLSDYEVHDPILIVSDDDFETQGWPGGGTAEDPFVIEGISIDAARGGHCIEIRNVSVVFVIENCHLSHYGGVWIGGIHASVGVKIFNSTQGSVENNVFVENGVGVFNLLSNHTTIKNNDFSEVADDSIISAVSSHVTISNNNCSSDSFSIYLGSGGTDYSPALEISESYSGAYDDITIVNNICTSDLLGIVIYGCTSGIIKNNTAFDNDCYWDTGDEGAMTRGSNFAIYDSQNLIITNNTGIADGVCLSIKSSLNISVVLNSFTSHEFHPAYDETRLAFFDYNYYSNYNGTDADGDGIGDTPYFDLYSYIQDEHPLMYYPWYAPEATVSDPILFIVIGGLSITAIAIVIFWLKRS